MRPFYIFDLDGTLALTEHRQHHVSGETKDWRAFFAACVDDRPNFPVVRTMFALAHADCEVQIWSGRSDEVREQSEFWLKAIGVHLDVAPLKRMRAAGDFTPDEVLKRRWLDELSAGDRARLVAVFDDRDKVVAMWRAAGVPCFQVAPGAF